MNIVFLVTFPFPYGEASSIRALNLCRLLSYAGYNVHVISDFLSDNACDADGYCTYEACLEKQPPIYKRYLRAKASIDKMTAYCEKHEVDCIFANARSDRYFHVAAFCKKKNIPLYIENCEWYDISSYKLGYADLRYYKNQCMLLKGFKEANGFVSISRFLDEHNRSYGKKSVRIPTIMDVSKVVCSYDTYNDKVNIVYTGNPGTSKEFLAPIVTALSEDEELQHKIVFHIYGPSKKKVINNIGNEDLLRNTGESVVLHGRVAQQKMPEIMRQADYLYFVRPNRRSSNAGFPTKFAESMAAGTPVITNDTGDIGLYLKDEVNGFLLKEGNSVCVKKTLHKVLKLNEAEKNKMRKNARKTADEAFDYRVYKSAIVELFGKSDGTE